jgi:hypothetical protein
MVGTIRIKVYGTTGLLVVQRRDEGYGTVVIYGLRITGKNGDVIVSWRTMDHGVEWRRRRLSDWMSS